MGAARRICVRAMVAAGMMSAIVSSTLPGCSFPDYGMASHAAGSAGISGSDISGAGSGPDDAGEGGDGGSGEGGESGNGQGGSMAGGAGASPALPCPVADCVPAPPKGWRPIAFWQGKAGPPAALPACPSGYDAPIDLHYDVSSPTTGCSCTCEAQGQQCQATLRIYNDLNCDSFCTSASPLGPACESVSGCIGSQGSVRSTEAPTVSGGFCKDTVTPPAAASWKNDARLCQLDGARVCKDPSQVCAPTPDAIYLTQLCVVKVLAAGQMLPTCPNDFPIANPALYETFSDDRSCSECGCSGVTGGSCNGTLTLSGGNTCSSNPSEFPINSVCKPFDLGGGGVRPTHVGGIYTVTRGSCGVPNPSHTIGTAVPSGQVTAVCCQAP